MAVSWHRKLGHLSKKNMERLLDLSTGINMTKSDCEYIEEICEICLKAKQTRLPFKTIRTRASRPLEIIHTDLCGAIDPNTWDEKKYVLTFLDDFTHYTVVYLLESKSEVKEYIKNYVEEVEAFWNSRVSKIRCDNGGEFVNKELKEWGKEKGIIFDYTIPHTPQLNGRAERLNRTIMDKARALIFDSKLDKTFWGEAVRFAAYLINRSPTNTIDTTPIEKWTNKKPNLSNLHIFGCEGFAKNLGYLKKLDSRTKKFIFVGYSLNGYRLFDRERKKIEIRRDVIFREKEPKTERGVYIPEENDSQNGDDTIVKWEKEKEEIDNEDKNLATDTEGKEERKRRQIKMPKKFDDYVLLTYEEVINSDDKENWKKAIEDEKKSLNKNNTWIYVDKDKVKDNKILSSRWVFKIKEDGTYKARLVVRGCEQEYGINYNETFSPVVNMSCLRVLFALAAHHDYFVKKFDVKTAFLYGDLDETIFMKIPEGYQKENKVCQLKKLLYGLKQAPREWNKKFTNFLKSKGLQTLKIENCIFKTESGSMMLAIHVDDGILIGKNETEMNALLEDLRSEFEIVYVDGPTSFLGIEIQKNSDFLSLKQFKYVESTLKLFYMKNTKKAETPLAINIINEEEEANTNYPFRELIGNLLYLSNKTRPDIAFAVGYGGRRMEKPTSRYYKHEKSLKISVWN